MARGFDLRGDVAGNSATKRIAKLLERASYHRRLDEVFRDWVELVEASLEALPRHAEAMGRTGRPAEDTEEAQALWKRMRLHYGAKEFKLFAEAMRALVKAADENLRRPPDLNPWDLLGPLYEGCAANTGAGQFFTPWGVALAMARITVDESEPERRLVEAMERASKEPAAQAWLESVALVYGALDAPGGERQGRLRREGAAQAEALPAIAPYIRPMTVHDPAVGSGGTLLAAAAVLPRWASEWGLVQYSGQDIDRTCVSMARINMMLYGLNGYGIRCAAALDGVEVEELPAAVREGAAAARQVERMPVEPVGAAQGRLFVVDGGQAVGAGSRRAAARPKGAGESRKREAEQIGLFAG